MESSANPPVVDCASRLRNLLGRRSLCLLLAFVATLAAWPAASDDSDRVGEIARRIAVLEQERDQLRTQLSELRAVRERRGLGNWSLLRHGQTRFEVFELLGAPGKVTNYFTTERWEYPGALGARVQIGPRGRVVGFRMPRGTAAPSLRPRPHSTDQEPDPRLSR